MVAHLHTVGVGMGVLASAWGEGGGRKGGRGGREGGEGGRRGRGGKEGGSEI